MDEDTQHAERLGGFGVSGQTCYVQGVNLTVFWQWGGFRSSGDDQSLIASIRGDGSLKKDSVCVIGSDQRTTTFELHVSSDERIKEGWDSEKRSEEVIHNLGDKRDDAVELRLTKHIFDQLDEKPPTAVLGFIEADQESHTNASWYLECKLSPDVLEQLVKHLEEGKVAQVSIGIQWVAGLVYDRHAPIWAPATWGLFKIGDRAQPLRGHVDFIGWPLSPPDKPQSNKPSELNTDVERLAQLIGENNRKLVVEIASTAGMVAIKGAKWLLLFVVFTALLGFLEKTVRFGLHW